MDRIARFRFLFLNRDLFDLRHQALRTYIHIHVYIADADRFQFILQQHLYRFL